MKSWSLALMAPVVVITGARFTHAECLSSCENKLSVCEKIVTEKPLQVSTPYILDNIPLENLQGVHSNRTGANGKAAVGDAFSQWVISTNAETGELVLKPDNPVLEGKIVINKKEQKKVCQKNYKDCVTLCK